MTKYKQTVIPSVRTPKEWNSLAIKELRKEALLIAKSYAGKEVVNEDTQIKIHFSTTNARKTSMGSAMYIKKATVLLVICDLLKYAEYSNFGERKLTDNPEVLGFLNFKAKCFVNGERENLRIAVQFCRGDKFYYNVEVNKIELLPKKSRRCL